MLHHMSGFIRGVLAICLVVNKSTTELKVQSKIRILVVQVQSIMGQACHLNWY